MLTFSGTVPENYDLYLGPVLFEPYAKDLLKKIKTPPRHILELACGTGRVTTQLLKKIESLIEIYATDLNEGMLLVAEKIIKDNKVTWLVADAQDLPFNNERFDLVICQFGIMFFPDKQKAMDEAYRVLEKNGEFIFNTWDCFAENPGSRIIHQVLKDYFKDDAPDFMEKGPFSFYDEELIKSMLKKSGFRKITSKKVNKSARFKHVDHIINGFFKGTPLAMFIQNKRKVHREKSLRLVRAALINEFGMEKLSVPMQAIIFNAIK